jgi:dihydroorotase
VTGRAFVHGRLQPVEVGIDAEGTIVRVARSIPGGERLEFGDRVLLPSAVDLHVHFRDPGGPDPAENFASGTIEAALGGVALVADMPNNDPPVTTLDRLREKTERTRRRLAVDVLLYASLAPDANVERLATEAGAFKLYLSPTTGAESPPAPSAVPSLLERVARTGLALSVHAEDPAAFPVRAPARTTDDWNAARPIESEERAIEALASAPPQLRLHVAHVTGGKLAERLRAAGTSFEATPHHLLLSAGSDRDPRRKVNPPLRSESDRAALFEEFRAGRVPCLASDHAPHSRDAKELPFDRAPSGVPGVETMLPLLLESCRTGTVPLPVLIASSSDHPARWLGVPRGRIAPGHLADLIVVDFRRRSTIRARDLHAPCGWTPFEGRPAVFPEHHLLRGEPVVEEGEYVGRPNGRVVRPDYAAPLVGFAP